MFGVNLRLNKDDIDNILNGTDENSVYVQSIVDNLVTECCASLDNYVDYVVNIMNNTDYPLTGIELDDIIMTIPAILYSVGTCQEKLGIKKDVSETTRKQMYNKIILETSGTATEKKSAAELKLFNEELVTVLYDRAYNIIKSKVAFATELLQSAKKVVSRRMAEAELSKVTPNQTKI